MVWRGRLPEAELREVCDFVLKEENGCKLIIEKYDPAYMDEGLRQSLYLNENAGEYVLIVRQKGYIMNAVRIPIVDFEEFKSVWEQGLLMPHGEGKAKRPLYDFEDFRYNERLVDEAYDDFTLEQESDLKR